MATLVAPAKDGRSSDTHAAYWASFGAIAAVVLGISLFTDPTRYADFDAYVYYLDGLVHFPSPSWMYFEVFSNIFLLFFYWITQSVIAAVVMAHYSMAIIFLIALAITFPPSRSSWAALLLMFAVLGPLLAFITLRATPAYFLVAAAVHHAIERRHSAWLCLMGAFCFHVSALLALPPLILLFYERKLPKIFGSALPRKFYLILGLIVVAIGFILPDLPNSVRALVNSIPVISKYDVYTGSSDGEVKLGHYLFLVFIIFLTFVFFITQGNYSKRLNAFVVTSFAIYMVLFFAASPIAAFRQAPYWIIPLIAAVPWQRLGITAGTVPLFGAICAGLFYFQFQQTYM